MKKFAYFLRSLADLKYLDIKMTGDLRGHSELYLRDVCIYRGFMNLQQIQTISVSGHKVIEIKSYEFKIS